VWVGRLCQQLGGAIRFVKIEFDDGAGHVRVGGQCLCPLPLKP